MFEDRKDAGKKLAKALTQYCNKDVLVLGIPRGGVEVGYWVAIYLKSDFSMIVSRKLPLPYNPEAGFGAIAEDGSIYFYRDIFYRPNEEITKKIIKEQKEEIKRRIKVLRGGSDLPPIEGRTVILVDDGIAMGSTMQAAIMLCRNKGAKKIVVAAPVGGPSSVREIKKAADEVIVLEQPPDFQAVAQVYRNWYDVPDEEVVRIFQSYQKQAEQPSAGTK